MTDESYLKLASDAMRITAEHRNRWAQFAAAAFEASVAAHASLNREFGDTQAHVDVAAGAADRMLVELLVRLGEVT